MLREVLAIEERPLNLIRNDRATVNTGLNCLEEGQITSEAREFINSACYLNRNREKVQAAVSS